MPFLRRPSPLLRLALLLAALFCTVVKPTLGLAGELHRDLHAAAHAAAAHASTDDTTPLADETREHAPADGWHALLHIDLCCGNLALPCGTPALNLPAQPHAALSYRTSAVAPVPAADPLRPPIRA